MSFTARRWPRTSAEVKSSAWPKEISRSTCALFGNANGEWYPAGMTFISRTIRRPVRNSSSALDALSMPRRSKQNLLTGQHVGFAAAMRSSIRAHTQRSNQSPALLTQTPSHTKTFEGSHVLVATGRTPNTQGIGLELAGVELSQSGYIKVNEHLETTAPGVWAIGEVAGSPQFTHVSIDDFRVVYASLTGG